LHTITPPSFSSPLVADAHPQKKDNENNEADLPSHQSTSWQSYQLFYNSRSISIIAEKGDEGKFERFAVNVGKSF